MDEELTRVRDLAARSRAMAKATMDPRVRKALLEIAADYDRLAEEFEAKALSAKPS